MINQTAEYALRSVVFLAGSDTSPVNRTEISDATRVPHDYLSKVLKELDRAKIVGTQRGPGGGYTLLKDPAALTVYDVIQAVSALQRIESCPLGIDEHIRLCPLHKKLDEAAELVEKAFRDTSIAELTPNRRNRSACQFPIPKADA